MVKASYCAPLCLICAWVGDPPDIVGKFWLGFWFSPTSSLSCHDIVYMLSIWLKLKIKACKTTTTEQNCVVEVIRLIHPQPFIMKLSKLNVWFGLHDPGLIHDLKLSHSNDFKLGFVVSSTCLYKIKRIGQ